MKNLKTLLIALFLACGAYAVATQVYHAKLTPMPASGADVAP